MLKFNPRWRFEPPEDGTYANKQIPPSAIGAFHELIGKIGIQGRRKSVLELFKTHLGGSADLSNYGSSDEGWAQTDLYKYASQASLNAPLFLEAFYDACQDITKDGRFAPDAAMINQLCEKHNVGYRIEPPNLVLREGAGQILIPVTKQAPTIAEKALESFHQSLSRADQLVIEGRYREAVQETLWVLESISTAFKGLGLSDGTVRSSYFNGIVKDLRRFSKGQTMDQILGWLTAMHGYLSSPTGGGVRHGQDLEEGISIEKGEAQLFCNLIRSYINYLLYEHERLTRSA